jgi:hypothetical protein
MSNYYSNSLSLILQNAGENSTTWGSFVNTNFQTLLEQAIVGQTTITMANADYTLTSSQGVSNEARNAVLIITGNQNATYNVIVPAVPKLYILTNSLNSGYTAYFKVTGSSTSFSVANGNTVMVYCTGSNTGTAFYAINYVPNAGNLSGTPNISVGNIASASAFNTYGAASFTGSISGTTMTVTAIASGTLFVGQIISGTGITSGTYIVNQLTGTTGSTGTYTVSVIPATNPTGSITITGAVGVLSQNSVLNGTTKITGNTTISGTADISGNTTIGGNTTVGGTSTLNGNTAITGTLSVTQDATFSGTGEIVVPVGTTAQRSALPIAGMFRYNSTTGFYESYSTVAGKTISSITYVTTTATLTTSTNHGLTSGNVVTITGASPSAYNGTFSITVTGTTTFTYTMATNPGANATVVGSYVSGSWGQIGGVTGLVAGGVVYENGQTISSNYTMTTGSNGMSAGPITVATGVTVTIPTGSNWVIV